MFLVIIYDYKINTVQKTTGDSGFFMPVYHRTRVDVEKRIAKAIRFLMY